MGDYYSKRMLIVINKAAGKRSAKSVNMKKLFSGYAVSVYNTELEKSTEDYVAQNCGNFDFMVCVGGDGTLNQVVNGMMRCDKKPLLGYIPTGSTNDFATGLKIPKDAGAAAKKIKSGEPFKIDIGSFNGRNFVYIASFGAFTDTSYTTTRQAKNMFGHMAYVFEAMKDITNIRPCSLTIETDSGVYSDDYIFGAISNSTSIGGLVKLSADVASLNDGMFEVMLIKMPKNPFDLQKIIMCLMKQQYDEEYITFFQTSKLSVKMDDIIPWSLDGEYEEGAQEIIIDNNCQAISLLL